MITLIVLIVLVIVGIYLSTTWEYDALGFSMCIIFGIWLALHSIALILVTYDYNIFVEKRNAFEYTLKESRENGNKYETATIVKDVAEWNIELAKYKYNNSTIFLDQYIDDRVELLELIK
jgi:hypothetical protein